MRVPFPTGTIGSEDLPRTRRKLQNCFHTGENRILARPGINSIATVGDVARGNFEWNGSVYAVYSDELRKFSDPDTGAFTVNVTPITDFERIKVAIGFNEAVIIVDGGDVFTLDKSDVLTNIIGNANFVPCVDVAHINGRFVYIPADGSPAFFSDVGAAGTVQALSFFDAEQLPDLNNADWTLNNDLYIAGTDSIQIFQDVGTSPVPYVGVRGRIQNGFIGGKIEYNNTVLFIGREEGQDFGIYGITGGVAPKISNEFIDTILRGYTIDEMAAAKTGRFKWFGFDIATFTLVRDSFAFFGGNWFILDTVVSGVSLPWKADFIVEFEGKYYVAEDDKWGRLDKSNTDFGERVTYIIEMGFEQENNDTINCQSIELGISQGFNTVDGSVSLEVTDDNILYGPPVFRNTADLGEYSNKLVWNFPGGCGAYPGFMGVRISSRENINFSADHAVFNLQ